MHKIQTSPAIPSPRFVVGRDDEGHWLVRDEEGHLGGLFASRSAAIHFAAFESDHRDGAVSFAPRKARLTLLGPMPKLPG